MAGDIPALARALHSASANSEDKLRAAEDLSKALLSSESTHIPALLRAHYISSLLDWLLNAIGRSGTSTRGKKKDGSETALDQSSFKLWKLLATSLEHPLISPERPLPASFLSTITTAVHQIFPPCQVKKLTSTQLQLLNALETLITLLGTKFSASFKPALDPTAALVEATLADQIRISHPGVGAAALDLLVPLLKQQPNPRKSWDAVVPRLFSVLINAGFSSPIPVKNGENKEVERVKAGCLEALSCALFNQAHVASIADAVTIALKPPKVEDQSVKQAAATIFTPKMNKLYTLQLFSQLEKMVEAARAIGHSSEEGEDEKELGSGPSGVFLALPWLIEQYCIALNRYKRAAEIAAAIADQAGLRLPTAAAAAAAAGEVNGGEGASKEKETRSIGGVSVDADFKFFTAITSLLQKKLTSTGEAIRTTVYNSELYRAVQEKLLVALGSVCTTLKPSHIYRPTEDPKGKHRQWLADLVTTAVQYSTPHPDDYPSEYEASSGDTSNTTASLKVLEAVLSVEHRGVQPHLPSLWPMLWFKIPPPPPSSNFTNGSREWETLLEKHKAQENDVLIQINVATSLIHAYGELRQLEVLLSSLVRALTPSTSTFSASTASAAAELVTSSMFVKVLRQALGSVPSGQVAALVRMVTSWIPSLRAPATPAQFTASTSLLIADLGATCLAALHVDVITAPAVADALASLIRGISYTLSHCISTTPGGKLGVFFEAEASANTYETPAGCVLLYIQATKLHTLCCLLHPEVVSLPGQELYLLNKEKQPSKGYLDAVLQHGNNGGGNDDSGDGAIDRRTRMVVDFNEDLSSDSSEPEDAEFWNLVKQNGLPGYFKAVIGMAAVQRLETLQYRKMHATHSCDPGSNTEVGTTSATTTITTTTAGTLTESKIENEMSFLGKILLTQLYSAQNLHPKASESFSFLSHFENAVAQAVETAILQKQGVLDALLESSVGNESADYNKMMSLIFNRKDNGAMQRALSKPSWAEVIPLALVKTMLLSVECIAASMTQAPAKKTKKKAAPSDEAVKENGSTLSLKHLDSPLERLCVCINPVHHGNYGQNELEKAFSETVKQLAQLASRSTSETTPAGSSAARSTRSGSTAATKRKTLLEHLPEQARVTLLYEIKNLDFMLSRAAFLLDFQRGKAANTVVVNAAIALSGIAVHCIVHDTDSQSSVVFMKVISKAMDLVAAGAGAGSGGESSRTEVPLLALTSIDGLKFLEIVLKAVETAKTTKEGTVLANQVQASVKNAVKKLVLDLFSQLNNQRSSTLLKWVENTLTSTEQITSSLAVLVEGVMAACEEFLVNLPLTSSSSTSTRDVFAISLLACFESHAPSLSSIFSKLEVSKPSNYQVLDSLAACAAHVIQIRCLAPTSVAEKLKKLPADQNCVLGRMNEDIVAIASILNSADLTTAPFFGFLSYLQAACVATGLMKPAATPEHFATLLCMVLHTLALLPVDASEIDPVRRIIPFYAAFPAASTAAESGKARAAALGALCELLAGSNSQQLRDVVAFVEKSLSTSTSSAANPYLLPITELGLMALEASRGKAALTTLAQRAERLASALTATLYNAACPLPQNSINDTSNNHGITSFAALYAAFLNTAASTAHASQEHGNTDNNSNRSFSSWTTQQPSLAASPSTLQILACSTALRALESIAARPKVFQLSSRHLARILNFIDILGNTTSTTSAAAVVRGESGSLLDSFNAATASVYANVCHLLTAFARHRVTELGRCLPLFGHAVRALLTVLVKWEGSSHVGGNSLHVRVYCAEALAAVMAEIANLNASDKYCPHILSDYLILAACPVTPTALTLLGSSSTCLSTVGVASAGEEEGSSNDNRAKLLCSPRVAAALRQGAYAVYGACGTAGVQYVYASFGSRGSGGLWRAGLAALKADHDKSFKYSGKV